MKLRVALTAIALLPAAALPLAAQHDQAMKPLAVETPWARATPATGTVGAAYFTIRNTGRDDDRLIDAATPAAASAELHVHIQEGPVMRMRRVESIAVPAGKTVTFSPGGYHLMLIGLKAPLKEGDRLSITLGFEKAGAIRLSVPVLGIGALGPGRASGHGSGPVGHRRGSH